MDNRSFITKGPCTYLLGKFFQWIFRQEKKEIPGNFSFALSFTDATRLTFLRIEFRLTWEFFLLPLKIFHFSDTFSNTDTRQQHYKPLAAPFCCRLTKENIVSLLNVAEELSQYNCCKRNGLLYIVDETLVIRHTIITTQD